jgi:hypothetical protein
LYSRTCFAEQAATQPDGEIDVATSWVLRRKRCPLLSKWVSVQLPSEAENIGKVSTAEEERRADGYEELLEIDIIKEHGTIISY